ncbi:MAG: hypothetical protein KNN16_10305 [Thermoflexus hugenholtzii]|uniref:hypothetical protein n=1 Tax=Thermoflexus hugenholtzii TaxID=1495650 RepID=UPI001C745F59|nr:hypothetical protein [Thermoflexus hugenholtzii]QWK09759.1 MAG: hypothetical protein KNN16_10305 [Thermoflexus hugenholtzii]
MPIEIGLFGRYAPGVGLRRREGFSRSAQADRWPKAFAPIEIGLFGRYAPGVGLRRRKGCLFGRRRPTAGRRLSRRLKSASSGAMRQASAFADAKDAFLVGAGRPSAGGLWRPNSFGVRAGRRPEAFAPIEIGLFGRYAPGVGLRRRKGCLFGRRRPTIGRRPLEAEFIRRAGWSSAGGLRAD